MPPWDLDATIEFTGSQLLHLNEDNTVYEEWEGFSDSDCSSSGDSAPHSSHKSTFQPAINSVHPQSNSEDDGLDDCTNDILNPPPGAIPPSPTIQGLQESVNKWAINHGFAVNRAQGRGSKPRVPAKDYIRYFLVCNRHGQPGRSAAKNTTSQRLPSRKCGCNWKAVARKNKAEGLWHFHLHSNAVHQVHNHSQAQDPSVHPQRRRLQPQVFEAIDEATKLNDLTAREIDSLLREKFPESVHRRRDIYNSRSRLRRRSLDG